MTNLYMAAIPHTATKNHFSFAVKTLYGLSWEPIAASGFTGISCVVATSGDPSSCLLSS